MTEGGGFRRRYGASPWHLSVLVLNVVVVGYVVSRVVQVPHAGQIALWFVGGVLVGDFVLMPLMLGVDWLIARVEGHVAPRAVSWRNHVRALLLFTGVSILMFWPVVVGNPHSYRSASGLDPDPYLGRWVGLVVAAAGVSAAAYAVRVAIARHAARRPG
jgi:hypothetical protein